MIFPGLYTLKLVLQTAIPHDGANTSFTSKQHIFETQIHVVDPIYSGYYGYATNQMRQINYGENDDDCLYAELTNESIWSDAMEEVKSSRQLKFAWNPNGRTFANSTHIQIGILGIVFNDPDTDDEFIIGNKLAEYLPNNGSAVVELDLLGISSAGIEEVGSASAYEKPVTPVGIYGIAINEPSADNWNEENEGSEDELLPEDRKHSPGKSWVSDPKRRGKR